MPLPQTLHRISTKVKKILKSNKHYRLRVLDSQHPRNPRTDILEKQATIYKSKGKEKFIRQIHHNIWRPLKLKTQSASGMQLITTTIFFFLVSLSWKMLITQICLLLLQERFPEQQLCCWWVFWEWFISQRNSSLHKLVGQQSILLQPHQESDLEMEGTWLTEREVSPRKKLNTRSFLSTALEAPKRWIFWHPKYIHKSLFSIFFMRISRFKTFSVGFASR